jgi:hypothetical protein
MRNPDTAWITIRQWDSYARRIERRHLRQYGTSLASTAIARRASACIIEIQTERMLVHAGWRQAMRQAGEEAHQAQPKEPLTPPPQTIPPPPRR